MRTRRCASLPTANAGWMRGIAYRTASRIAPFLLLLGAPLLERVAATARSRCVGRGVFRRASNPSHGDAGRSRECRSLLRFSKVQRLLSRDFAPRARRRRARARARVRSPAHSRSAVSALTSLSLRTAAAAPGVPSLDELRSPLCTGLYQMMAPMRRARSPTPRGSRRSPGRASSSASGSRLRNRLARVIKLRSPRLGRALQLPWRVRQPARRRGAAVLDGARHEARPRSTTRRRWARVIAAVAIDLGNCVRRTTVRREGRARAGLRRAHARKAARGRRLGAAREQAAVPRGRAQVPPPRLPTRSPPRAAQRADAPRPARGCAGDARASPSDGGGGGGSTHVRAARAIVAPEASRRRRHAVRARELRRDELRLRRRVGAQAASSASRRGGAELVADYYASRYAAALAPSTRSSPQPCSTRTCCGTSARSSRAIRRPGRCSTACRTSRSS